ncbi:hypothetical protein ALC56_15340 [Trachymyrmex septentrionalis]|uniref:Uncharacterized protein n=1 Tax=Trachymyrmex septentrionalis TaxID=34720 RepID=A0A151JSU8_9HYME|nr:hypothetical protein ALC56_15340 [Trachymyrmex septentrionalis]
MQETSQNEVPDLDKLEVNLNKQIKYCQSLQNDLRGDMHEYSEDNRIKYGHNRANQGTETCQMV